MPKAKHPLQNPKVFFWYNKNAGKATDKDQIAEEEVPEEIDDPEDAVIQEFKSEKPIYLNGDHALPELTYDVILNF